MIEQKDILRLLMEKFAGEISEEDNYLIEERIDNNEEVKELWKNINEEMNSARGKKFVESMDENKAWKSIQDKLKTSPAKNANDDAE